MRPIPYPIPTDGPVGSLLSNMGRHAMRPAHIHCIIQRQGFTSLTTHLFVNGDPYLSSDTVFGVKRSLVVDFVQHEPGATPDGRGSCDQPFYTAAFDFTIARA